MFSTAWMWSPFQSIICKKETGWTSISATHLCSEGKKRNRQGKPDRKNVAVNGPVVQDSMNGLEMTDWETESKFCCFCFFSQTRNWNTSNSLGCRGLWGTVTSGYTHHPHILNTLERSWRDVSQKTKAHKRTNNSWRILISTSQLKNLIYLFCFSWFFYSYRSYLAVNSL